MNIWKVSTFGFAAAFAATLVFATARPAQAEAQPQMQAAKELLAGAKKHLENAKPDKGGHRVKAMAATQSALDEVNKGIEFDNKN
jgi:hypothetical protein